MPTPFPAHTLVPVYGTWDKLDGSADTGTIVFTARPGWMADSSDDVTVTPSRIVRSLDASGHMTVNLLATDDPNVSPTSWTYIVTEQLSGGARTYDLEVPLSMATAGINLRAVVPASPSPGVVDPVTYDDSELALAIALQGGVRL